MAKVRITNVHPLDAHYSDKDEIIGLEGEAQDISNTGYELFSLLFRHKTGEMQLMYAGIQLLDRKVNSHYGENISD